MSTTAMTQERFEIPWGVFLLQGIGAFILGIFLLTRPAATLIVVVEITGILWVVNGIITVAFSFAGGDNWGLRLLGGLVMVVAGVIVAGHPIIASLLTPVFLSMLIGVAAVVNGIVEMVEGFREQEDGQRHWSWGGFFVGLFTLIAGLILLASPLVSAIALVPLLGVWSIVSGIIMLIAGFVSR